jgi:starch phosphorylase
MEMAPRTFIFGAKAAPGYAMAKLIIKFLNNLGDVVNNDPAVRGRLKVYFLPNYCVSLAERIIPATEVSEQISLAGFEASGTGNMKFMLNGALTVGTLDGANVEMLEEVGAENIFIFGLTVEEATALRRKYKPRHYYESNAETRAAVDLIAKDHFSPREQGIFKPLVQMFLEVDTYMHMADLPAYVQAQEKVEQLYRDKEAWSRKAVLNVAYSGKFSSDRTIQDYAREIWKIEPNPISPARRFDTMMMAALPQ